MSDYIFLTQHIIYKKFITFENKNLFIQANFFENFSANYVLGSQILYLLLFFWIH